MKIEFHPNVLGDEWNVQLPPNKRVAQARPRVSEESHIQRQHYFISVRPIIFPSYSSETNRIDLMSLTERISS